jgi:hypothetical protein
MASSRSITVAAIMVVALSGACVSTPVSAPSDGQILLSANPSRVVLDEFAVPAITAGTTVITAQIFDTNSVPQPGVEVFFSADGGELASSLLPSTALETDDNGRVSDTLTLALGDPSTVSVTVRSGTLSSSLDVNLDETAANQPPFPVIDITPGNSATINDTVIYDGSFSDDPDGDAITCYQWQIETGANINGPELACTPPNSRCEIAQGPGATFLTRSYNAEQLIAVTLRVTDDPAVLCAPGGPAEPPSSFNGATVTSYEIVCDRTAPTASAGPNQAVDLAGNASVGVPLSGAASADQESGIASYDWNCGNGTPIQSGVSVVCSYTSAAVYSATLTVTNGCGMTAVDAVTVTVNP